jgi:type IV secretion system protein VirB11
MEDFQSQLLIGTAAYLRGNTVINDTNPILECDLPVFGCRFEAIVPPVVAAPIFAIRRRAEKVQTLDDYVESGILSHRDDPKNRMRQRSNFLAEVDGMDHRDVLMHAIENRWNILVAGSTGSGKTTFLNTLLEAQTRLTPHDRTVIIEDTPELNCKVANSISLLSSAHFSMLDCLLVSMRLIPKRITVGEVRGKTAEALVEAWNTGHPGGFATLHADNAELALVRLEALVAKATAAPRQDWIAQAVNLVVFIESDPALPAGRKVKEVCVVTGYKDGRYQLVYV